MKGNFKGIDTALCIVITILFFGVLPCFCLLAKSDAAIIIIAVVPMMIGVPPLVYAMNTPCAYDADEKCLTMKKGSSERTFRYRDIKDISCKYIRNESSRAVAELTIIDGFGVKNTYRENCNVDMTALLNDPDNTKRPQLFQLCDYVKQAKEAGA